MKIYGFNWDFQTKGKTNPGFKLFKFNKFKLYNTWNTLIKTPMRLIPI